MLPTLVSSPSLLSASESEMSGAATARDVPFVADAVLYLGNLSSHSVLSFFRGGKIDAVRDVSGVGSNA